MLIQMPPNPPIEWFKRLFDVWYIKSVFLAPGPSFFDAITGRSVPPGILMSYVAITYYDCPKNEVEGRRYKWFLPVMQRVRDNGGIVMLDSGAFTAWSKGHKIDLRSYIEFCIAYSDVFTVAVALDVIGDSEGTKRNLRIMEDAGVRDYITLIPVFHHGSPISELYEIVDNYEWVGLGGIARMTTSESIGWLRHISSLDLPVKYHLFGVSNLVALQAVQPFSIDTSLWTLNSSMGRVITEKGTFDLGRSRSHVMIPSIKAHLAEEANRFGLNYNDLERHHIPRHIFNWFKTTEIMSDIRYEKGLRRRYVF